MNMVRFVAKEQNEEDLEIQLTNNRQTDRQTKQGTVSCSRCCTILCGSFTSG